MDVSSAEQGRDPVEALVGYDEAARLLGVARNTVYFWVHTRRVPHVRLGPRCVRFRPSELRAWIDAHAVREAAR